MTGLASTLRGHDAYPEIRRYFDPSLGLMSAKLLPGDYYVTDRDEAVVTVLGSCVAACIRDRRLGVGGMNHFMLPRPSAEGDDSWGGVTSRATRYGTAAMEQLVNDIIKRGGRREHLEIKIFGGGRVLPKMTDVGRRNVEFVHEYLKEEGLKILAEDTGDVYPRQIQYFPISGRVRVKRLGAVSRNLAAQEQTYLQRLDARRVEGPIELFGD